MSGVKLYGDAAVSAVGDLFANIADYPVEHCYFESATIDEAAEDFRAAVSKSPGLKLHAVTEADDRDDSRTICITGNGQRSEAHARLIAFVLNNRAFVRDAIIEAIRRGAA